MRIGEAINLNIGNFDWSKRTLNITAAKTKAGLLTGSRIIYSNFRTRIFKPAASFIGLPELLPHDLRRTAATLQVGSGTPHKVVQERLGHADIRTTLNLYAQATGEAHTEAVRRMEEALTPPTPISPSEEDVA